jgi:hypothetical protein
MRSVHCMVVLIVRVPFPNRANAKKRTGPLKARTEDARMAHNGHDGSTFRKKKKSEWKERVVNRDVSRVTCVV